MINVTDGPIKAKISDKILYEAESVTFEGLVENTNGVASVAVIALDGDGQEIGRWLVEFKADAYDQTAESKDNANTFFRQKTELLIKALLEAANPSATFTIV